MLRGGRGQCSERRDDVGVSAYLGMILSGSEEISSISLLEADAEKNLCDNGEFQIGRAHV